jgi:AcrR family transcriptional regulator
VARTVYEKADVVPMLAEVFREFGFEGASLGRITARTGLGKGSLYHFFPGGKEEMAREILNHVDRWFVENIFQKLEREAPREAIEAMWQAVAGYFESGRRICLVGAFALDETREPFAAQIKAYFIRWIEALRGALARGGVESREAGILAELAVGGVQGALVLARATNDPEIFPRLLTRLAEQIDAALRAATEAQSQFGKDRSP